MILPVAIEASRQLLEEGVFANVINVTGPGPLYSSFQASVHAAVRSAPKGMPFMSDVIPLTERNVPAVTVVDGHPHALAWIGGALATPTFPLGVTRYGQSGSPEDLYSEYEIDAASIMAVSYDALGM